MYLRFPSKAALCRFSHPTSDLGLSEILKSGYHAQLAHNAKCNSQDLMLIFDPKNAGVSDVCHDSRRGLNRTATRHFSRRPD